MDDYLSGCLWLGAAFLLGIADELYKSRRRRVGGSENGRGVEGHAPATRLGTERTKGMCAAVVSAARTGDADTIPAARDRVAEPMVGAGIKPSRPFSEPPFSAKSFFGARTAVATGAEVVMPVVSSPMGKQSREERPPRLWPCEKAVLAGFEPRDASDRTPRDTEEGPEDPTGVTAGETALEPPAIGPRESVGGVSSFVGSSEHGPASADGTGAGPLVAGSGRSVWDRESITAPGAIAPDRDAVRPLAVAREH